MTETWITVQSKTFTKWLNTKLENKVCDISVDLRDGVALCGLIQVLTQKYIYHSSPAITRFQKIENVQNVLNYLTSSKLKLINIGSTDIVDGNTKLTLGLVWTIIKKFAIRDEPGNEKLLKWCKAVTSGYNIPITNFGKCWQDGMGFNAIIHRFRPDLINYSALQKTERIENLDNAFRVAEEELLIPKLFDAEDIAFVAIPDEKIIMTYLSLFYDKFGDLKDNKKKLETFLYAQNKKKEAEKSLEIILNNYKRDFASVEKNNEKYKKILEEIKNLFFENESLCKNLKSQKISLISLQGSINSINDFYGDKNEVFEEIKEIENEVIFCERCGKELKDKRSGSFCNYNGIERKNSQEVVKAALKESGKEGVNDFDYHKCLSVLGFDKSIENQILGLERLNLETKNIEIKKVIEDKITLFNSLINKKDAKKVLKDAQEMFENVCDKINKIIKKEDAIQILKILGLNNSKGALFCKNEILLEEFLVVVKQCHNETYEINKIKAEFLRLSKDGKYVGVKDITNNDKEFKEVNIEIEKLFKK